MIERRYLVIAIVIDETFERRPRVTEVGYIWAPLEATQTVDQRLKLAQDAGGDLLIPTLDTRFVFKRNH